MSEVKAVWPPGSTLSIGQAVEFLVWAPLITQSRGRLHVFLPYLDRGIDALIHRLEDGAYLALQVKGKSVLHGSEGVIEVLESHLFTPDQLVIGVHLDGDHLGPFALVADAATFKRKATAVLSNGRVMLEADMPVHPIPGHRWSEDLIPLDNLAERLGAVHPGPKEALAPEPVTDLRGIVGFWGELEVTRRVGMLEDCGLFRPFPDNETNELLVRRLATGSTLGIQIKTAELTDPHDERNVWAMTSSFAAAPTTYFVVVGWVAPERRFHETCLVIPSDVFPSIANNRGHYYELHFRLDATKRPSRTDQYRIPLESLAETVSRLLDHTK
jgi:hypothetical protein